MGLFNKKLSRVETQALVCFWKSYMTARKAYEEYQKNHPKTLNYKEWMEYLELKQDAFKKLLDVIPEVRYTDFWRAVTMLQPEAVVDGILMYRRKIEADREQRAAEKSIIAGQKLLMQ